MENKFQRSARVVAWRQLVENSSIVLGERMSVEVSQCDNMERICLDVIALAEWLAPGDVTFTSVISGEDHSRPGQPFMISTSDMRSNPEYRGLKKLFLGIQTRMETSPPWASMCFFLTSTRRLNKDSSRCLGDSRWS